MGGFSISAKLIAGLAIYILGGRWILRHCSGQFREFLFAILNLAGVFWCLFFIPAERYFLLRFAVYVFLILFQFWMLLLFVEKKDWKVWLAFYAPILVLIVVRYIPLPWFMGIAGRLGFSWRGNQEFLALVGISYLAFRCSRLVLEVRQGAVPKPGLWEYLNYAFFLPTMPVGPINTYANFREGFGPAPYQVPLDQAAMRILVGLVKYAYIGGLFNQLTFSGILLNEHSHHWIDLPVAMVAYYLYLYCNFSGFCDMAIGTAAFMGIPVPENFVYPFAARNVRDFWNRWHITLSVYMRDIVFAPLSKFLVRLGGTERANHAIAVAIFVVFLLIGMWHGVGWHFAAYGAVHGIAVVTNHYYTLGLKKWLGRDGFKAYNSNTWIRWMAVTLTFSFCAASLFLFANTTGDMKNILASFRH